MGKIREVFQKMSLKRSLVLLAVFCLSLVSALSVITILTCSSIQKKIIDTRPIIITELETQIVMTPKIITGLLPYRRNIHMENFQKKINYIIGALRFLWCPYPLPIL